MTTYTLRNVCGLVYVIIAIVNAAPSSKLPKGFIQCKLSDPKISDCVKNGIQSAIPQLVKGVPSLGINKVDPLRITRLELDQGSGPVSINLKFKDLDINNLKSLLITKLSFDPVNLSAKFEVIPKTITLNGLYDINGKVLILPIVGNGKSKITVDFSSITGNVQLKKVAKNGNTYLDIDTFSWDFKPSNMHIKLDNLFNGDKALGDNMNVFLNENWREVIAELQPIIEQGIGAALIDVAQQFLKRVPSNQIFLE